MLCNVCKIFLDFAVINDYDIVAYHALMFSFIHMVHAMVIYVLEFTIVFYELPTLYFNDVISDFEIREIFVHLAIVVLVVKRYIRLVCYV